MTGAPSVVVVGDLLTDVVAHLDGPLAVGSDAPAAIQLTGGGGGANVAAWLAATGTDVAFVGKVGSDESGRTRAAELRDLGVRLHLATAADHPTGTVVVLVDRQGERTMVPDRGANLRLSPDDLPHELFTQGRHLHLSGYVLLDESSRPAGLAALHLARQAGMTTSVDPSSAQPLAAVGAAQWLSWTQGVDVCLSNLAEALVLTGADGGAAGAAASLLAATYSEVVVTCGADGAVWSDGPQLLHCPAQPVTVHDTTGAGDAFTAGYVVAFLAGDGPRQRLAAGCRLAAEAVGGPGARPRF